ncbi:hypothetical protein YC2023_009706 [Brassica napus]
MDYIDSETQEPDDLPYLETEYGMPPPLAAECKNTISYLYRIIQSIVISTIIYKIYWQQNACSPKFVIFWKIFLKFLQNLERGEPSSFSPRDDIGSSSESSKDAEDECNSNASEELELQHYNSIYLGIST